MTTPIDGFKKNLEQVLPEHLSSCEQRVAAAEENLKEQREALAYVRGLAALHGITKATPSGSSDVAGSTAGDTAGAIPLAKE